MNEDFGLYEVLKSIPEGVIGVSATAFNRITPSKFLSHYQILCSRMSSDLPILGEVASVEAVKATMKHVRDDDLESEFILNQPEMTRVLTQPQAPEWLLAYKVTSEIYKKSQELGLKLIGPTPQVRERYEDKARFYRLGRDLGLPMIPGKQVTLETLLTLDFDSLSEEMGENSYYREQMF